MNQCPNKGESPMTRLLFLALSLALAASSVAKAQPAKVQPAKVQPTKAQTAEEKIAVKETIQGFDGVNFWDGAEYGGYRLMFITADTISGIPNSVVFAKPVELEVRPAATQLKYPRLALMHFFNNLGRVSFVNEIDCAA